MGKWYIYENEEVVGPFEVSQLEGRVTRGTLVCRAGEEDWEKADEIKEFQSLFESSDSKLTLEQTPSTEQCDNSFKDSKSNKEEHENLEEVKPTLEGLANICQHAENDELIREYKSFWQRYDRKEKNIIRIELENRGIFEELTEDN